MCIHTKQVKLCVTLSGQYNVVYNFTFIVFALQYYILYIYTYKIVILQNISYFYEPIIFLFFRFSVLCLQFKLVCNGCLGDLLVGLCLFYAEYIIKNFHRKIQEDLEDKNILKSQTYVEKFYPIASVWTKSNCSPSFKIPAPPSNSFEMSVESSLQQFY